MIEYTTSLKKLSELNTEGFFVGWPNPPKRENFIRILEGSYKVCLAIENNKLVGFINSISDGVLSAYIPLLEVLPEYQDRAIGKELVKRITEELKDLYMVDLLCDEDLVPYYVKLGMSKATGALLRNYDRQSASK